MVTKVILTFISGYLIGFISLIIILERHGKKLNRKKMK